MTSNNPHHHHHNPDSAVSLQLVPETILKRKHDLDEVRAQRASHLLMHPNNNKHRGAKDSAAASKKKTQVKIMKPETIIAAARSKRNHATRWKRVMKKGMQARANNNSKKIVTDIVSPMSSSTSSRTTPHPTDPNDSLLLLPDQQKVSYAIHSVGAKLVFCIRIRDAFGMPTQIKKGLSKLGLRNVYEGVFLKYDSDTRKLLQLMEPWVIYGIPSKSIILDLIQRRGHGKLDGKKIPLTDNTLIEKALGEVAGILCIQDLVEELFVVGRNFHLVQRFLWPFQLESLRTKYQRVKLNQKEGGQYGDQGELMDDVIRQIL